MLCGVPGRPDSAPLDPIASRDAGLRRITGATRLLSAGAVALVAVVTVVASGAHPGRSAGAIRSIQRRSSAPAASSTAPPPAPASGDDPGLRPPAQAPAPSEAP